MKACAVFQLASTGELWDQSVWRKVKSNMWAADFGTNASGWPMGPWSTRKLVSFMKFSKYSTCLIFPVAPAGEGVCTLPTTSEEFTEGEVKEVARGTWYKCARQPDDSLAAVVARMLQIFKDWINDSYSRTGRQSIMSPSRHCDQRRWRENFGRIWLVHLCSQCERYCSVEESRGTDTYWSHTDIQVTYW